MACPDGENEPSETCTLITTLLDHRAVPAGEIMEGYLTRWSASETTSGEDKSTITGAGNRRRRKAGRHACRLRVLAHGVHVALRVDDLRRTGTDGVRCWAGHCVGLSLRVGDVATTGRSNLIRPQLRPELRPEGKRASPAHGLALLFALFTIAEDARFELARACTQHAFQVC